MEEHEYYKMGEWLNEKAKLFPPTNSGPTETEREEMFYWANKIDPKGGHRASGCGRCYYNARAAILKRLNIF